MTTKEISEITKDMHLLYVETDKSIIDISLELFKIFFTKITVALNSEDALEKFDKENISVIITDINMPKSKGIDLVNTIRNREPNMPIIVYSSWSDPSFISACISLNIVGYLQKPLLPKNLLEALENTIVRINSTKNISLKKSDISERSDKLYEKFQVDELTELKSHNSLIREIDNTKSNDIPVFILINIDEFNIYNELYGINIGDKILISFAKQLVLFAKEFRYDIYRMSGDEFVLFEPVKALDTEKYEKDIEVLFNLINTNPIIVEGVSTEIILSVTIGISFSKENSYGKADMAVVEARRRGKRCLGFSTEADRSDILRENLYWKEELGKALSEKRVHAYYHSIVDKDKNIMRYEALVRLKRMKDGVLEVVKPHKFLDTSKVSKQYIELTKVMINESFETMMKHNVHVAINLTFHDIENKDINNLLYERISKHKLASKTKFDISSQVIFELLEYRSNEDFNLFTNFIYEFKKLGVLVTIDNFGLGFSDMSKIAAMSPNYVKIDSTLVKSVNTDKHSYFLVKAIVKFAHELGIKTIAEHVTSEEIFLKSLELGIDEFQGYYFSEPVEFIDDSY